MILKDEGQQRQQQHEQHEMSWERFNFVIN